MFIISFCRLVLDIYETEERPMDKKLMKKIPLLVPKVTLLFIFILVMLFGLDNLTDWTSKFQVPQQTNGEECGIFVLQYANLFLKNAPENFSASAGYPYFVSSFFIFCQYPQPMHSMFV